MDTNINAHYVAIQTERSRLAHQAERGWIAEQAAVEQHGRPSASRLRQWAGGLMILAGERLQGTPTPALHELRPRTSA